MPSTTIKYFSYAHLPAHLQTVSRPLGELAEKFEALLPDGPEKSAGMRKLLEAKDCFVRCALDLPKTEVILQPHQQRVVDEFTELSDRMAKLLVFFNTDMFNGLDAAEQERMRQQFDAMDLYGGALKARIKVFAPALVPNWPDPSVAQNR